MKPTVLIVNNDETITQQLYWTLCDDYDVVTATDLQSAVRRATIYEPDLSLIDLELPPTGASPEIALRIVEYISAHVRDSRIVVMAPELSSENKRLGYAAGADEFIDKPFDVEELLRTFRRLAPRQYEVV